MKPTDEQLDAGAAAFEDTKSRNWGASDQQAVRRHAMQNALAAMQEPCEHRMVLVTIRREPTDPICMRASVGGTRESGYYLVWRGDRPDDVVGMLRTVLAAAERDLPPQGRPQG